MWPELLVRVIGDAEVPAVIAASAGSLSAMLIVLAGIVGMLTKEKERRQFCLWLVYYLARWRRRGGPPSDR